MPIAKARIRNFRSIIDDSIDLSDITLLVGQNDVGKSNYLRALNLFFNNETEPGVPFSFLTDYAADAPVLKGKAREVIVDLTFETPLGFSKRDPVIWRKSWRADSLQPHINKRWHADGVELSGRQKIGAWLDRMKFKYVPAIKGNDYFRHLLRDLHDTLSLTVEEQLRDASKNFIHKIQGATQGISTTVSQQLGMASAIQIPKDLRTLFEVLDFETARGAASISLKQRGDGIKVRHIPAILKFLADQEAKLAAPGKTRTTSIWAYEEPENNLELASAFRLAEEFLSYSSEIQILLTTHSAAFYQLASRPSVTAYVAQLVEGAGTSAKRLHPSDVPELDASLGLMPLVAPYIADREKMLKQLASKIDYFSNSMRPIVFVGGSTDEAIIRKAIDVISGAELSKAVEIKFIGQDKQGGTQFGGDTALKIVADFVRMNPTYANRKVLIILDCDARQGESESANLRVRKIPLNQANTKVRKGIENLFPEDLFTAEFYAVKNTHGAYGETNSIQEFNKKKFSEFVCSKRDPITEVSNFAGFAKVVEWIHTLIKEPLRAAEPTPGQPREQAH